MTDRADASFKKPITVALTGASGAQYGLRLIDVLVAAGHEVWVMISKAAHMVIATETDIELPAQPQRLAEALSERSGAQPGDPLLWPRRLDGAGGIRLWRALHHGGVPVLYRHAFCRRNGG